MKELLREESWNALALVSAGWDGQGSVAEAVMPLERTVKPLGFVGGARSLTMVAWVAPSVLSSISPFGHPLTVGVLVAESQGQAAERSCS